MGLLEGEVCGGWAPVHRNGLAAALLGRGDHCLHDHHDYKACLFNHYHHPHLRDQLIHYLAYMIKFVIVSRRWWLPTLSLPTWSLFLVGDGRLHAQDHRCHLWGRSSGFEIIHVFLYISSFWITLKIRPPLHLHTFLQHLRLCPICIFVWIAFCSFTFILFFFSSYKG